MVKANMPVLITDHLCLRPWKLEDAPNLVEIMQEAGIFQYFPPSSPPTLEKAERYISFQLEQWGKYGYGHWAVTTSADGQLAGWNGLEFLPETQETEVGYLLGHAFWGMGYATEAAGAALEFGFRQAGLARIIGLVHPENLASIRVLEKCGMRFIDEKIYFGMEMRRYRIDRSEFENKRSILIASDRPLR